MEFECTVAYFEKFLILTSRNIKFYLFFDLQRLVA